MGNWRQAITLVLATATLACGRERREGPGADVRPVVNDSAGIRIVDNATPPEPMWRVEEQPLFSVGWRPEDPAFTFIQSGRITPDGGAIIGDSADGRIYRLSSEGEVLEVWGRMGEGPGEYQSLPGLVLAGDSIIVSDSMMRRVTVLSSEGEVLSTAAQAGDFRHHVSAVLADGRLLIVPGEGYSSFAETRPQWVFQPLPIFATDLPDRTETLADLPHLRRWLGARGAPPGPIFVKGRAGGYARGFAWARADEPAVRWYDGSGNLVQIARWEERARPLTPEWEERMAEAYREAYASRNAEEDFIAAQLGRLREGLDRYEGPLPFWEWLHVDHSGNVWLGEYGIPGDPPSRWHVVAQDGTSRGWMELPPMVALLDVTDEYVLGVQINEMDVQAVVKLRLTAP